MPMSGFNHSRPNRQPQLQCPWIVQAISSICQIPVPIAHWGLFLRRCGWLQMFSQGVNDLFQCATLEPSLLGSAPLIWSAGSATLSSRSQVFADMKEIAQEASLQPEHFVGL